MEAGRQRAVERLRWAGEVLKSAPRPARPERAGRCLAVSDLSPQFPLAALPSVTSNFDRAGYLAAVRRAIEYIHAGDCFQVNLSQRLLAPATLSPLELYGRLRERNPAPFAGYFDPGGFQIARAPPELFLHVPPQAYVHRDPTKGTCPRGARH